MIWEKIVPIAYAYGAESAIGIGAPDPKVMILQVCQLVMMFFVVPVICFFLATRHAKRIIGAGDFSVLRQVFKFTIKVLLSSAVLFLLFAAVDKISVFFWYSYYSSIGDLVEFILSYLIIFTTACLGAGTAFLLCVRKNKKFLRIALSFLFVVPVVIIFLLVLVMMAFPSLRKYVPADRV